LDEPTKYKLTEQQGGVFTWLKENCGGVQSGTLCYWAKYYTFDRIKEVFLESKSRKPKSLGAYMNSLFKMNAIVPNDTSKECREFAEFYKKSVGWHDLKIEKKFVTFSVGKNREELFLHIPPEQFAKILMEKYQSQRRY
jgi:hypothetical protein